MFDRIISLLADGGSDDGQSYSKNDIAAAVAALYFHMISADGVLTMPEIERFRELLREQFDLNDEELDEVCTRGAREDRESPGLFPFTAILNRALDANGKAEVLDRLHQLAIQDGTIHAGERAMLTHVKKLLKLDE